MRGVGTGRQYCTIALPCQHATGQVTAYRIRLHRSGQRVETGAASDMRRQGSARRQAKAGCENGPPLVPWLAQRRPAPFAPIMDTLATLHRFPPKPGTAEILCGAPLPPADLSRPLRRFLEPFLQQRKPLFRARKEKLLWSSMGRRIPLRDIRARGQSFARMPRPASRQVRDFGTSRPAGM